MARHYEPYRLDATLFKVREDWDMSMPEGPCLGCKDRIPENPEKGTVDCHKNCKMYNDYRKDLETYKRSKLEAEHERKLGDRPWMKRYKRKVASPYHD